MTDKRALWTRLKTEQPDLAAFLADFNRLFGKPGALRVTDADGRVLFDTIRREAAP